MTGINLPKPAFIPEIKPRSRYAELRYKDFLNAQEFHRGTGRYTPVSVWARAMALEVSMIDRANATPQDEPISIKSVSAIVSTETREVTTSPLETVQESTGYYFTGCDPYSRNYKRHTLKTTDLIPLLEFLQEGSCVVIGDMPYHRLLRRNLIHQKKGGNGAKQLKPETLERIEAKALREAKLYGEREKMFLEAIQDWICSKDPSYKRKPILLVSDTIENDQEFTDLVSKLEALYESNPQFQEEILKCIPENARKHFQQDPSYALWEIALILHYGTNKLSHEMERPYDEAAQYAQQYMNTNRKITFEYPEIPNTNSTIPYRVIAIKKHNPEEDSTISLTQPMDWGNIQRDLCKTIIPIFGFFIQRLKRNQPGEMLKVESMKMLHQAILELRLIPRIRQLLLESGLLNPKDELAPPTKIGECSLPFECKRKPQESQEGHIIRYLAELIQGLDGPMCLDQKHLEAQVGFLLWGLLNELYSAIEGDHFAEHTNIGFDQNMWPYWEYAPRNY